MTHEFKCNQDCLETRRTRHGSLSSCEAKECRLLLTGTRVGPQQTKSLNRLMHGCKALRVAVLRKHQELEKVWPLALECLCSLSTRLQVKPSRRQRFSYSSHSVDGIFPGICPKLLLKMSDKTSKTLQRMLCRAPGPKVP